jgi:hypothetical protein
VVWTQGLKHGGVCILPLSYIPLPRSLYDIILCQIIIFNFYVVIQKLHLMLVVGTRTVLGMTMEWGLDCFRKGQMKAGRQKTKVDKWEWKRSTSIRSCTI